MKNLLACIITTLFFSSSFLKAQVSLNDPRFSEQWYLYMPGVPENQRADIRAYEAWGITKGDVNTKIAIIEGNDGEPAASHI